MTVTIIDLNDSFYKTPVGESQKQLYQSLFKVGVAPIIGIYPSNNKVFDQSFINIPQSGGADRKVILDGLEKNRFYIHIVIDGDRFKLATELDTFLADYIKAFNFN